MGEKIPCEYSKIFPCEDCKTTGGSGSREVELTEDDAERYLPREGQNNMIVPRDCPIAPMSSIIQYRPDYFVLKAGRVLRKDFVRSLPNYKL